MHHSHSPAAKGPCICWPQNICGSRGTRVAPAGRAPAVGAVARCHVAGICRDSRVHAPLPVARHAVVLSGAAQSPAAVACRALRCQCAHNTVAVRCRRAKPATAQNLRGGARRPAEPAGRCPPPCRACGAAILLAGCRAVSAGWFPRRDHYHAVPARRSQSPCRICGVELRAAAHLTGPAGRGGRRWAPGGGAAPQPLQGAGGAIAVPRRVCNMALNLRSVSQGCQRVPRAGARGGS